MYIFEILLMLRKVSKALKKIKSVIPEESTLLDVTTQAAAYGFEIGRGQPMKEIITTSIDNPFMAKDWRNKVIHDG